MHIRLLESKPFAEEKNRWCSHGGWRREMYCFSPRWGRAWISLLCKYTQCGPYQVLLLLILIYASHSYLSEWTFGLVCSNGTSILCNQKFFKKKREKVFKSRKEEWFLASHRGKTTLNPRWHQMPPLDNQHTICCCNSKRSKSNKPHIREGGKTATGVQKKNCRLAA